MHLDEQTARDAARIVVLTGQRGVGKTTACRRAAELAASRQWRVAGLLSPAILEGAQKTGILITDLRTGRCRRLATLTKKPEATALGFRFDEDALAWANGLLAAAPPCDLLIIDELGPLELNLERGLTAAFARLQAGAFQLALVVVRPQLVDAFWTRLGRRGQVLDLSDPAAEQQLAAVLARLPNR
ncbi:MAG: nucleoside-triphosphatase [Chloroflexota bacterium]